MFQKKITANAYIDQRTIDLGPRDRAATITLRLAAVPNKLTMLSQRSGLDGTGAIRLVKGGVMPQKTHPKSCLNPKSSNAGLEKSWGELTSQFRNAYQDCHAGLPDCHRNG